MDVLQEQLVRDLKADALLACALVGDPGGYVLQAESAGGSGADAAEEGDVVVAGAPLVEPFNDLTQELQFVVPVGLPALQPQLIGRSLAGLHVPDGCRFAGLAR